ncbi:malto-oligosyltrehalose trehalohydrolase [Striga asiatica]|uniref:Malto-oligosyltrehalose trehalohydrolase n=1 Tax=Striga asiatica TaxID=4170 RepID=A0A5A7PAN1_STRAF|nr:malto-oligosyltrehalose trehalohydrolase [Striga asiatica]
MEAIVNPLKPELSLRLAKLHQEKPHNPSRSHSPIHQGFLAKSLNEGRKKERRGKCNSQSNWPLTPSPINVKSENEEFDFEQRLGIRVRKDVQENCSVKDEVENRDDVE